MTRWQRFRAWLHAFMEPRYAAWAAQRGEATQLAERQREREESASEIRKLEQHNGNLLDDIDNLLDDIDVLRGELKDSKERLAEAKQEVAILAAQLEVSQVALNGMTAVAVQYEERFRAQRRILAAKGVPPNVTDDPIAAIAGVK